MPSCPQNWSNIAKSFREHFVVPTKNFFLSRFVDNLTIHLSPYLYIMRFSRTINVVGVHAAGEVGDVIIGGVLDVPGKTMYEKMIHFSTKADELRQLLLNEPRGRPSKNANLILPPCDPRADAGFIIMESEEYPAMSGSNTICTTTALLETGIVKMEEPITNLVLDTPAGLVSVTTDCEAGKCKAVSFDNVPAFAQSSPIASEPRVACSPAYVAVGMTSGVPVTGSSMTMAGRSKTSLTRSASMMSFGAPRWTTRPSRIATMWEA